MKICKLCGVEFKPSYQTVKYCCKEHAKEADRLSKLGKPRIKRKTVTRKSNKSLSDITAKAKELGISYGQYTALYDL
jgi:hypothetical protein